MLNLPTTFLQSPILLSPLNWGIGHATRCMPIIQFLLDKGFDLIVAAEGGGAVLIQIEFPSVEMVSIPSYSIHYAEKNFDWAMFKQIPKIVVGIMHEHRALKKLIEARGIKTVIADNRYGLWSSSTYSVFITHQLNIQLPAHLKLLQSSLNFLNCLLIHRFNECWVPDNKGVDNISGILSQPALLKIPITYIGILSRFEKNSYLKQKKKFQYAFILSGPEPQRTIWEEKILAASDVFTEASVLVRGLTGLKLRRNLGHLLLIDWMNTNEIEALIASSKYIVCRSGYSSMMDLVALNRKAIVVATPGQTEQEYLANYLEGKGMVVQIKQADFNFQSLIQAAERL